MGAECFSQAVRELQERFASLDWTLHDYTYSGVKEKMYHWPGHDWEDIMVVVHKSSGVREEFHRHNFFFFNYTYQGCYESLSQAYDNRICINEGELYAGQPQAAHALFAHDNQETIIIGLLIKPQQFFRWFLPLLPTSSALFGFFLNPKTKAFADEYIHFKPEASCELRSMLEMMVIEYASGKPDTQAVLRTLAICYLSYLTREYALLNKESKVLLASDRVREYLNLHFEKASLPEVSEVLGYHPSYLSALIKKETGKTFSELLLTVRMERAAMLLENTALSVNDVSLFLGYSNTSNFYKAFKDYYKKSPRELIK